MKKIAVFMMAMMVVVCCSSVVRAEAKSESTSSIDELLRPYEEVILKVNNEIGSSYAIPDESRETVYEYYGHMSLDEFEQRLADEYYEFVQQEDTFSYTTEVQKDSSFSVMALREDIRQRRDTIYNSYVDLYATVFGGGNPTVYRYTSINNIVVGWPEHYTGFHFHVRSTSYELSADRKSCTVTLVGCPVDAAGLTLTVDKTVRMTFIASW